MKYNVNKMVGYDNAMHLRIIVLVMKLIIGAIELNINTKTFLSEIPNTIPVISTAQKLLSLGEEISSENRELVV